MGCPDWPRCFGRWVPPTSVNQLPENYKEEYTAHRDKKNQKFARYLTLIGLQETSNKILNDKSIAKEADFNVNKTWVEYVNRLVGVAVGFLIVVLFAVSSRIRIEAPKLFTGALLLLILVIVQGWFGSIVVSTNLTGWTVTVHMFLALVMVALLVWLLARSGPARVWEGASIKVWLVVGMAVLLTQIFLGTQLRETLDRLANTFSREEWIGNAGLSFVLHRSFSWAVLLIQVILWLKLRKTTTEKSLTLVPFVLILLSLLTGTAMAYFAVPPSLQPIHLLLAVVTFGWFFQVYLQTDNRASIKQ